MPDVSVLDVRLYDTSIATLTHVQGDRTIFAFNQSYIEDANRPTLSLSFKDQFGELITDFRPVRRFAINEQLPGDRVRRVVAIGVAATRCQAQASAKAQQSPHWSPSL